jgi:hypothetical protein
MMMMRMLGMVMGRPVRMIETFSRRERIRSRQLV